MEETTKKLQAGGGDPDATLVQPRFGAREERTAQPVVPLAGVERSRRPTTLPLLLILASALVGGLVSVLAYQLYQQQRQQSSAQEQQQQPAAVESASPQDAPAPELAAETLEADSVAVREEFEGETEARAGDGRVGRESSEAREGERREEPRREERPARNSPRAERREPGRVRRVEEITAPTDEMRIERERDDGREATDDEAQPDARERRRRARRNRGRNTDRVRAIFEGPPPS